MNPHRTKPTSEIAPEVLDAIAKAAAKSSLASTAPVGDETNKALDFFSSESLGERHVVRSHEEPTNEIETGMEPVYPHAALSEQLAQLPVSQAKKLANQINGKGFSSHQELPTDEFSIGGKATAETLHHMGLD